MIIITFGWLEAILSFFCRLVMVRWSGGMHRAGSLELADKIVMRGHDMRFFAWNPMALYPILF